MADGKSAAAPQPRSRRGRAADTRKMPTKGAPPCLAGRIAPQDGPSGMAEEAVLWCKTASLAGQAGTWRNPLAASRLHGGDGWRNKLTKTAMPRRHGHKKEVRRDTSMGIAADSTGFIPAGHPHSGMLPCFLGGLLWFLLRHISRAHISLRRVSRGMMTSSMSPRSAVRYGLENSSS